MHDVKPDSAEICKKPSDRDRPPDTGQPDGRDWGKKIGKEYPCAKGDDCEYHGNTGPAQPAEQAIEKEQASDAAVAGAFDP